MLSRKIVVLFRCRCDCDRGVRGGAVCGQQRAGVRRVRSAGAPVLPDSADGAHGPQRGHLEAPRISGLRTQAGKQHH